MPKSEPYYPHKGVSYGNVFFFIKYKTHNFNPFDKESIEEAKTLILREAKEACPNYQMFIKAATAATGLSERTIRSITNKEK